MEYRGLDFEEQEFHDCSKYITQRDSVFFK